MHFKERGRATFPEVEEPKGWTRDGGGLPCSHVIDRTMVLFSYPLLPHGAKGAFQATAGVRSGGHKPVQIKKESR